MMNKSNNSNNNSNSKINLSFNRKYIIIEINKNVIQGGANGKLREHGGSGWENEYSTWNRPTTHYYKVIKIFSGV